MANLSIEPGYVQSEVSYLVEDARHDEEKPYELAFDGKVCASSDYIELADSLNSDDPDRKQSYWGVDRIEGDRAAHGGRHVLGNVDDGVEPEPDLKDDRHDLADIADERVEGPQHHAQAEAHADQQGERNGEQEPVPTGRVAHDHRVVTFV